METALVIKKTKWGIDMAHSEIGFKVKHLMISNVKGTFKKVETNILAEFNDFTTATIDVTIDAASIDTGDAKRDEHLRSTDFFDVVNYKKITFTAISMGISNADGIHALWGNLTIKGITKKVKLDVFFGGTSIDPWKQEKAGITVSGKINRTNWGLLWNTALEAGGVLVSEDVNIVCELELLNEGPVA